MQAVVEFHAFIDNAGKYIIKELAVVAEHYHSVTIFKPPYRFHNLNESAQKSARWLQSSYHRIGWYEGSIPFDEDTVRKMFAPFDTIFTKGLEKARFLRQFHTDVRELPNEKHDVSCKYYKCILPQHNNDVDCRCALRSAKYYYDLLLA